MMNIILKHFTNEETIQPIHNYENVVQNEGMKPIGFWLSVGDAWAEWMRTEATDWYLEVKQVLTVALDCSKILVINTEAELDAFHNQYKCEYNYSGIDWPAVTAQYDGILMTKYHRSRRYKYNWYSSWDIASACIWNTESITSVHHDVFKPAKLPEWYNNPDW